MRAIDADEAGQIVHDATATARAMATSNAQAAATEQMRHQVATEARQATLDALAALQTESALQLTQAAATDMAAAIIEARTQAAAQTLVWATPTAAAMRAAATATSQAQRAQATAQAAQDAARMAQAESAGEFWQTVRFIFLALLIVGGLSGICVAVLGATTRIKVARLAQQAIIAREAFRSLPPGHWAEWQPGEGYQVYTLPGQADAPATVIENVPTTHNTTHDWRQAVRLFCWWGDRYGFGIRELGPTGAGVVSDPDWRVLSKLLKGAGVLAEVAIDGRKGKATAWAPNWNYLAFHDALGHGQLALPFPSDTAAPKVRYTVPNTTPRDGQHNTATQESA
jgi:hypothetical protein